jgi:hypothetical protein
MGWAVSTFDNKYQIKYGSNTSYLITEDDVSYLTITDTKHIGINNENPSSEYLLDINGETHINSNVYITGNLYISNSEYINSNLYIAKNVNVGNILYTSNIIGVGINNSNNIKINYTTPTHSNNSTEIYGNTSFIGKVKIENVSSNTFHLLDIDGSLRASRIYGEGCNVFNINANNVSHGILETNHGGTGLSQIVPMALLYGGANNTILQTSDTLRYDNNTLYSPAFAGSFDGFDIKSGFVRVSRGGTGLTSIPGGRIPFGNPNPIAPLLTTPDFIFNEGNRTLEIHTLKLANSNIYLTDVNGVLRIFNYNDLGIYNATSNSLGLVIPSPKDFNTSNGFITIRKEENAIWQVNEDTGGSNIYFPNDVRLDAIPKILCAVGINTRYPQYPLDVVGDINTKGNYKIDGEDIKQVVVNYAISNLLIDDLTGVQVAGLKRYVPTTNAERDISNREGIWRINNTSNNNNESTSVEVTNLITTNTVYLNRMFLNNTDDANAIPILDNEKYIFKIQDRNTNLLKFSKTGNMLVGNNSDTNDFDIPPTQRLEIIGNIHATGYIRSYYSDDRLKTFTSNITDALNIIDNLKGFHYVPNDKAIQLGFTFDNEIGLSAQDVQRVVPEIVKIAPFDSMKDQQGNIISKSGEGYLTICYERLGAVFVEAIKELRQENKKLKDEIDSIKKDLDNCKRIIYIQ